MNEALGIKVIQGAVHVDDRGALRFFNEFDFKDVKRFYQVENFGLDVIRAFHGHLKEAKYVYVASGSIILCAVQLDDFKNPSRSNPVSRLVLSASKPQIVYIPARYANGFRVLEQGTKIIFFSTSSLQESQGDDYRYPHDYWGSSIWEVENR